MRLAWRNVYFQGLVPISTSITEAETAELQRLAKGAEVLEVGAAYGYSTVILASVAKRVTSVDPHQWLNSYGTFQANLGFYNVTDKVRIYVESSTTALPHLAEHGELFDLIFIDGDHGYGQVTHDIGMSLPLLRPDGVLALHDLDEETCPGVREAVDAWRQPDVHIDTLAIYHGPLDS